MDILRKARQLESKLAHALDGTAQQWTKPGPRGALEVVHAIVEAIEQGIEPAGRGTHLFPFNRIRLSVVAPSREVRGRLSAVFEGSPTLQERIAGRLRAAGCEGANPQIKITYVQKAGPDWNEPDFHLEFDRMTPADAPAPAPPVPGILRLFVLHGRAEKPSYVFANRRINLGRCAEVRDSRHRLLRTNHVVFGEAPDDANCSVSRHHAHIDYSEDTRQFRLCDDGSAHGTGIVRHGRTIPVPPGARGIALRSGDELVLGEARLRLKIDKG
jgi:hypothetical protein